MMPKPALDSDEVRYFGETVAFVGLTAGMILPVAVAKVFATGQAGTIASNIVALY